MKGYLFKTRDILTRFDKLSILKEHEMTEARSNFFLSEKRGALTALLVFTVSLQLSGCLVGYKTFKVSGQNSVQPIPSLPNVKTSYALRFTIRRTLQNKFDILDMRPLGTTNLAGNRELFVIRAQRSPSEMSKVGEIWAIISMFSLAAIPAIVDEDYVVRFTLIEPGGEETTLQYRCRERLYSWLPFVFFNPGFYVSGNGFDKYQKERDKMLDEATTRFITDTTPFILSHTTLSTP